MKFFIDSLPVSVTSRLLQTEEMYHIHFAQIIFPYDRIYPGAFTLQFGGLELIILLEQYAYMCDLKRTLDATVRFQLHYRV